MADDDGVFHFFTLVGAAVVGTLLGAGLGYILAAVVG